MILAEGTTPEEIAREVFDPGSPEEAFLAHALATGRENHERPEGLLPVGFLFGEKRRSLFIVNLAPFWGSDGDEAAGVLRSLASEEDASIISVLCDCWKTTFRDEEKIEAAGLDLRKFHDWPPAAKRRFLIRREALTMSIESRLGFKLITQFYRRDCGKILWEELEVADDYDSAEGRFVGLLPPRKGPRS